MTQQLRDTLARLADTQPPVPLAPDLWERGRRVRRRDRVVAGAAALVLVATLGGMASLVLGRPDVGPAAPDTSPGAVPSRVWAVPERLTHSEGLESTWDENVRETSLAVGRASLAFVSARHGGLPVVVTAADGDYHLLDLPGWIGAHQLGMLPMADQGATGLALSPDGTRLAWAYGRPAEGREDYSPVDTGVRVADLTTGEVRDVGLRSSLTEGQAVVATVLVWSPDSRWLAWQGRELRQWNASGAGSDLENPAGRIAPGLRESEPMDSFSATTRALAISSEGVVTAYEQGGRVSVWDGARTRRFRLDGLDAVPQAASSPDGSSVAVGSWTPVDAMAVVAPQTGRASRRELSSAVYAEPVPLRPVGWLDDTTVAAIVQPADDPTYGSTPQLVVMTAPDQPRERWTYRIVGRFDPGVPVDGVSVAVDLMSPEQPTRDLPAPDWPWSTARKAWTGVLLALLAALAAYVVRRRLRAPGARP